MASTSGHTSSQSWSRFFLSIWLATLCLGASAADPAVSDLQAFDSSIGTNFTSQSCPRFFKTFLSDKEFKSCYPFSLLLQTSATFFANEQSHHKLTASMDATCKVDFNKCQNVMSTYNTKIRQQENCGADYNAQNPFVMQAVLGLSAYKVMYRAGCQKTAVGGYCFADAVTNISSQEDSYPYFLPLGISLPPDARPSCSPCVKSVMESFASAASEKGQVIATTYAKAARQLDTKCGPGWIPTQVGDGSKGAAPSWLSVLSMVIVLITYFEIG